jgi:hypothetical protein
LCVEAINIYKDIPEHQEVYKKAIFTLADYYMDRFNNSKEAPTPNSSLSTSIVASTSQVAQRSNSTDTPVSSLQKKSFVFHINN